MGLDEDLNNLEAQRNVLDFKINQKRREKNRQEGKCFASLEELTCRHHKDAVFEKTEEIEGSYKFKREEGESLHLAIYECKQCKEDKKIRHFNKSRAYECENCGIVPGEVRKVPYRSSEESWRALAGRKGEHYHCLICGEKLGYHYWGFS